MNPTRIVVVGAAGRMGRTIIRTIAETEGAVVCGALEPEGSAHLGADAGVLAGCGETGVIVTDDPLPLFAAADAVIDFSVPAASVVYAGYAAQARIAHILGTTGWNAGQEAAIAAAARHAPIVKSGNMSLGVNLLAVLVEQAARALGPDAFDIEIVEMHHRHKVDAPSGTALLLGEAAASGRGVSLADHAQRVRDGHTGPRPVGEIGFATLRGGSVVGDHSVILAGPRERIVLTHNAEDREIFARGAVRAALWARARKPGLYSMRDVLGLGPAASAN
jgi:4-hydroxy-tetrahydrodipicolinate reductase